MSDMELSDNCRRPASDNRPLRATNESCLEQTLDEASPIYLLGRQPFVYAPRAVPRDEEGHFQSRLLVIDNKPIIPQRPQSSRLQSSISSKLGYTPPDISAELADSMHLNRVVDKQLGTSRFLQYTYTRQQDSFKRKIDTIRGRTYEQKSSLPAERPSSKSDEHLL